MIEKLGHYKIVSELGRGGMGVVYKAYEESLNRYVAIKLLGEHLSHDESFVKRFVREAKAAAALSHPNVIQIFFIGEEEGKHYFVMEFVEGRSVHDVLAQEGRLDPVRAARIVQQAASGLAAAHDQGLVHRDVKPANLLVTKDERVKIADFGLALAPTDGATRLTATNSLMGTPGYLSPEQCCGEPAGPKSDIYSLGMTFYEMLTGAMPFRGESPLAVLRQILDEEPPPLLQINPGLDPRIAKVVERMVAKEPKDRYQTCYEVIADLNEIFRLTGAVAAPTAGVARAAAPPPLPPLPPSAPSSRTQARVSGRPEDAPTMAGPTQRLAGTAPPAAPVPAPAQAAAAVAPVVAAATAIPKSSHAGRWVLIAGLAVMLVIAVSAAGLYFAAPMLMDAPFLRDVPFLKEASFLKGAGSKSETGIDAAQGSQPGRFDIDQPVETASTSDANAAPPGATDAASVAGAEDASTSRAGTPAERYGAQSPSSTSPQAALAAPAAAGGSAIAGGSHAGGGSNGAGAGVPVAAAPHSLAAPPAGSHSSHDAGAQSEIAQHEPAAPRRAPIREKPRVAVVAIGEPTFAGAAEQAMESQLARHGLDLYDEHGILELRDSGGASQMAPSSLLHLVAQRGVDILVLIDVEPLRDREVEALGRYSHATTARVRVDALLAADGDAVGRGWSQQVEYAEPNAESKADSAVGTVSTEVADAIAAAWQDHRSGAR